MTGRLLLLVAMLALLALATDWQPFGREEAALPLVTHRLGYYLDDIELRDYARDGRMRLQLRAAHAEEDPGNGEVTLSGVRVDWQPGTPQAWQLTAERARAPQQGDIVELAGDVRMSGEPGPAGAALLRTPSLRLDTAQERASTRDEVILSFGTHEVRARGLQADLKAGKVRLESGVHGTFKR